MSNKRKGVKCHIFGLNDQEAINQCLANVRLAEHGINMVPGSLFRQGKVVIFENLDPLPEEENNETVTVGAAESDMLRTHDQKWRKLQADLLNVDLTLDYFKGRKGKGSSNTKLETDRTIRHGEELRTSILSQMAMVKKEVGFILAGRYPQLTMNRPDKQGLADSLKLPDLTEVEPEAIYGSGDTTGKKGNGPRKGS